MIDIDPRLEETWRMSTLRPNINRTSVAVMNLADDGRLTAVEREVVLMAWDAINRLDRIVTARLVELVPAPSGGAPSEAAA
jgi:hypothetical protein